MGRAILGIGAWGWRGRGGREGELEWVYSKGGLLPAHRGG